MELHRCHRPPVRDLRYRITWSLIFSAATLLAVGGPCLPTVSADPVDGAAADLEAANEHSNHVAQ